MSYIIFLLSCTILQLGFVCSILLLFFCTDTNHLRPGSDDESGGSRWFLTPVTPQYTMEALPIQRPLLPVPPYQPCPIWSVQSVHPVEPSASQLLSFWNPLPNNLISPGEPIPRLMIHLTHRKSQWYQYQSSVSLPLLPLYCPRPVKPLLWREKTQASHYPRQPPKIQYLWENHISRSIQTNHWLLVRGSNYFYIVPLVVCFVSLGVNFFGLQ